MNIRLNFQQKKPLAEQIHEGIREEITARAVKPGEQLPTVREMATRLGVNFNTVARAYRMLDMEGWITMRQGRGTYVLERQPAEEKIENGEESHPDAHSPALQSIELADAIKGELASTVQVEEELLEHGSSNFSSRNADIFLEIVLAAAAQAGISHPELVTAFLTRFGRMVTPHSPPKSRQARIQKYARVRRSYGKRTGLIQIGILPRRQPRRHPRRLS